MIRIVLAFIAACMVVFVLGSAALTAFDVAGYLSASTAGGVTAPLSIGEILAWYFANLSVLWIGQYEYPALLSIGLLIAFVTAGYVQRLAPSLRFWWYAGAGAVAMVTMVLTLKATMGLFVVPGARTVAGIAAQGVAGFIGGAVYALVSRRR